MEDDVPFERAAFEGNGGRFFGHREELEEVEEREVGEVALKKDPGRSESGGRGGFDAGSGRFDTRDRRRDDGAGESFEEERLGFEGGAGFFEFLDERGSAEIGLGESFILLLELEDLLFLFFVLLAQFGGSVWRAGGVGLCGLKEREEEAEIARGEMAGMEAAERDGQGKDLLLHLAEEEDAEDGRVMLEFKEERVLEGGRKATEDHRKRDGGFASEGKECGFGIFGSIEEDELVAVGTLERIGESVSLFGGEEGVLGKDVDQGFGGGGGEAKAFGVGGV